MIAAPKAKPDAALNAGWKLEAERAGEYFRALADQSLDIVTVLDAEGTIVFDSASIERWTGWHPDELVGRNAFQLIHPADLPMIIGRFAKGLESPGSFQMVQFRFRHKDGTWRVLESWGKNLLGEPSVRGVVITSRDVTERKSEERRRSAVNEVVTRLNSLESLGDAASALATVTEPVFGWETFSFSVYSAKSGRIETLLSMDVVDGRRTDSTPVCEDVKEGTRKGRALQEGPLLFNAPAAERGNDHEPPSMMAVPIPGARSATGVMCVGRYTLDVYTRDDLDLLSELAGHCSAVIERILARMELVENESRYRLLVERLPVAVLIHENERVVYANPSAAKLLGSQNAGELTGREISKIAAPEMLEVVRERIERAKTGESMGWMEQKLLRMNGSRADAEATSLATTYNGRPAVQTILHEITERKRAEQRQAVQYAATRVLANGSYADAPERMLGLICEGLGWKTAELWTIDPVSRGLRLTAKAHPPEARFRAFAEAGGRLTFRRGEGLPGRVWAEGTAIWATDMRKERGCLRRELGAAAGFRTVVGYAISVRDEFGGMVLLFSDTERQRDDDMLELLKVLGTQLGQFLERKQMQEQLLQAQKMEAVGQLAGGVAHDFNNILTIITGRAQLALVMPDISEELRGELEEISSAVTRAASLTRQLLTFSRKQMMQKRCLQLDTVINDLAKMLRRLIGEHVTLALRHETGLPAVEGDVGMIEQVLLNLAVNARDAMPEGGDLTISTQKVDVDGGYARRSTQAHVQARAGSFVRMDVRDNGCGMAPEVLARVFEPFFTTKPAGRGTGLGLATVYGIVKQHGGWVDVDSHVNVGTAFQVYLPISTAAPTVAVAPGGVAERGKNERILLVEDEASLRTLAQKLLERSGYRVVAAASGTEALGIWRSQHREVDLVLTDMVMPGGMSGKQLADELWASDPAVRVIFTSGYTNELSDESVAKERLNFLAKPYTPSDLLRSIADALAQPSRKMQ